MPTELLVTAAVKAESVVTEQHRHAENAPLESDNVPGTRTQKKGRPKLSLTKTDSEAQSLVHNRILVLNDHRKHRSLLRKFEYQAQAEQVPRTLLPPADRDSSWILHSISYYNDQICPAFMTIDSDQNPHRINMSTWRDLPDYLVHIINSAACTHRIVRSRLSVDFQDTSGASGTGWMTYNYGIRKSRLEGIDHPLKTQVYNSQALALRWLGNYFKYVPNPIDDNTIALVTVLVLAETLNSAYDNWRTHWEAIAKVIAIRGGFAQLAQTCPATLKFPLSIYALVDVMYHVTVPSSDIDPKAVSLQLQYQDYLSTIYQDGYSTGFSCPNEMLRGIIRVNHLRACLRGCSDVARSQIGNDISELLREIALFSPEAWAQRKHGESLIVHSTTSSTCPMPTMINWKELASLYQAALLLYGIRTLVLDSQLKIYTDTPECSIQALRETAAHSLISTIQRAFSSQKHSDSDTWVCKFMFWPVLVAGIECCDGHDNINNQLLVSKMLCYLCYYLGNLSIQDALLFLQSLWQTQPDFEWSWDDRVRMLGGKSVFFI